VPRPSFGPPEESGAGVHDGEHRQREHIIGEDVRPQPTQRVNRIRVGQEVMALQDVVEAEYVDQRAEPEVEDSGSEHGAK